MTISRRTWMAGIAAAIGVAATPEVPAPRWESVELVGSAWFDESQNCLVVTKFKVRLSTFIY